jgi:hypothetical protein
MRLMALIGLAILGLLAIQTWPVESNVATLQQYDGDDVNVPEYSYAPIPNPKFAMSDFPVVTGDMPLILPQMSQFPNDGKLEGITLGPPKVLDHPRTDQDILAEVNDKLSKITERNSEPRIRQHKNAPPGLLRRYGIPGNDDGNQVVVVVECDCNARPLILGAGNADTNVKFITFVADRRYPGIRSIPGPGSPMIRELLNDNSIPIPTPVGRS